VLHEDASCSSPQRNDSSEARPLKGQKFILFACALRDIFEGLRQQRCSCRLATPGLAAKKKKRTRKTRSTLSLLQVHSFLSQPPSRPFLPTGWLYFLAPLDSSPSGGRHLNWTAAIAVVCRPLSSPRKDPSKGESPKKLSALWKYPFRSCIFQKLLSSKTTAAYRDCLQMSLTLWTQSKCKFYLKRTRWNLQESMIKASKVDQVVWNIDLLKIFYFYIYKGIRYIILWCIQWQNKQQNKFCGKRMRP